MPLLARIAGPLLCLAAASGPAAARTPVTLGFDAYGGGLFLVHGEMTLDLDAHAYSVALEARGGRLVDFLTRWSYSARGEGTVGPDGIHPRRFLGERHLRGRTDVVELRHQPSGAIAVTYRPASEDLGKVPAELRRDALDPVATAVAVLAAARTEGGCAGTWPVYDGRRRYDLVAVARGPDAIRPGGYSIFAGPAQRCAVTMRPVAGFDPAWKGTILREGVERTADVWFGPLGPDRSLVPVRIQVDLDWGSLVLHLVSVAEAAP